MKKLITVILILALILPAAALAADSYLVEHYALLIDAESAKTGKDASPFDFDSLTIDLYMTADQEHGYLNITRSVYGVFLNDGMIQVRLVDIDGSLYIVTGSGDNFPVRKDDETGDMWIAYGASFFRMHRVEPFNLYSDWQ